MSLKEDAIVAVLIIAVTAAAFFAGVSMGLHRATGRAQAAQAVSDTAHGQAVAHADAAAKLEPQAKAQASTVARADTAVRAAKHKLANLPEIPDSSTGDKLSPIVAAQAAVIQAQDKEIAELKLQVSIEHASALQWKLAYENEAKALEAQQVVSKSYEKAMKEASWKSGFKGALTGIALGYVAGRLQH